jgi:hypothetical protein
MQNIFTFLFSSLNLCLFVRAVDRWLARNSRESNRFATCFTWPLFLLGACYLGLGASEGVRGEEFPFKEAYTIEPQLAGKKPQLESFSLGPRGNLWMGCRIPGENGTPDSGHIFVYDPTGLLFNSFPIAFVPQAINFSTKSWLYVASSDKIVRMALQGNVEAELNSERLYETKDLAKLAQSGRPSIAATDDAVFVAYPQSEDGKYRIFRLSPDLSIEAEIISDIDCCARQLDLQTDGKNILITEASQGKVSVFNASGKRIKTFGKKSTNEPNGFSGECNPLAIRVLSEDHVLTGEIGSGALKKFKDDGTLVSHLANVKLPAECRRISIGFDEERNWYYMMNASTNCVSVIMLAEEVPEAPIK